MENLFEQSDVAIKELEIQLAYWKEVLQKSEKYERLMADPDFQDVLKDVAQTVEAHGQQIQQCLDGMSEYSLKLLEDAKHTIFIHQLLREQAQQAAERPRKILELVKEARKKVPDIEDRISKMREEVHG